MGLREEIMSLSADSVGQMLRRRVAETPDKLAFMYPDGKAEGPNTWSALTWRESNEIIDKLGAGLLARGVKYEDRVAICSSTRVEWIFMDLAIAVAAGATTTVYPNTASGDVHYIVSDSGSSVFVAENAEQLAKVLDTPDFAEQIHTIVVIDGTGVTFDDRIISYDKLMELGEAHLKEKPDALDESIASTNHDTLSTLIYTSGTTGRPKGVRLNHLSWVYEGAATKYLEIIGPDELQFLWLPLSHVFGKALIAAQLDYGFASAVDGRIDKIVQGLGEVHPTFMCGAPRIFEKVRAAVLTSSTGVKGKIARWAFSVGYRSIDDRLAGRPLKGALAVQYKIADKLVFSKLKERLGGQMKFMISGSAKLSPQIQKWFYGAGILIVEGYGATETSAIAAVDLPADPHFGTVGAIVPGVESKLADDGELLLRGPIITPGYHNLPDQTAEAIDDDGWYHTGDIAEIAPTGHVKITDRKKDLFKTSGGKFVAPQKVEGAIQANIPYVSQSIAVGEGRKYVAALIVLDPVMLQKWADKRELGNLSYAELSQRPEIRASIEKWMSRVNERLEKWETVKQFAILDHELTVENAGVTANMKVRRGAVTDKYADVVDTLYPRED
ncbi:long-chain fatty acid--CoA ligase [Tessaracoccus sp. MC1865]|uniref:AMP-dependent synthetase/ligase n=1 Tax=unclassified Tessaracoccus TaxID=2635419 RepID=UPI001604228B|nr:MULTISPECIES: long-chain fatty acid--CoA ligase [unclassified Tessaracoccus]MBB1484428.1 long-chain fatty acid--CoA ligase [Tessaracoccus sp. MC1865]MBB1509292.1 long-chain fatty acid--CoA ligase [Tessaracoccus sp. MC1756]QTO38467.1 long-chain fatty acid--CoA ligase [Tessaracoccus sp. MC1865]